MGFYRFFMFTPSLDGRCAPRHSNIPAVHGKLSPYLMENLMIHFGGLLSLRYFYKYIYIYIYIYLYINTYRGPITSGTFWCQKVIPRYLLDPA